MRKSIVGLVAMVTFLTTSVPAEAYVSGGVGVSGPGYSVGVGVNSGSSMGGYGAYPWLQNPFGLPQGSILGIVGTLTYWLLAILGFLAIIGFVVSGILYLLAFGDEDQAKKGKAGLKYSIYGIIVALLGFIIIQAATRLLSGTSGGF